MSGEAMIRVDTVSKWFGNVVAVSEVSCEISQGVTALLGPNGAGKSTLLRVIAGLTRPSKGRIEVLGADPRADPAVRGRIGLVPQQDALFDALTAREFVELAAATHGMDDVRDASDRTLGIVDLSSTDTRPCKAYSKGMRQRVKVAQAIVHDPEVIILDEPLTGLDPVQRRALIAVFRRLGEDGKCVVVSSHVLDEVARIGTRVVVIAQGRLAATGDFHALRELMDDKPMSIRVLADDARALAGSLLSVSGVVGVQLNNQNEVIVDSTDVDVFGRAVARVARDTGVRLRHVDPLDDDLESVFRYLVECR
ncbi:MAG: ABC transporter ATP-binding protein [Actinomycetota bacterium]|nr:ABC transporter ATP-binding protein [Actinomycetota bacterium]